MKDTEVSKVDDIPLVLGQVPYVLKSSPGDLNIDVSGRFQAFPMSEGLDPNIRPPLGVTAILKPLLRPERVEFYGFTSLS